MPRRDVKLIIDMRWLTGLNSLRFYAIVLIVIYHLFHRFLPGGFIAVDIFFTISGFLIISKLVKEYSVEGKIKYRSFIKDRFMKIFPPLLICVAVSLALALFVNKDILAGIQVRTAAALTFTTNILELITGGNYENTISPNPFEHTWFLALEMQFYLLMPLIAKIVLGIFRNRRRAIRNLGIMFVVLAILSDVLMVCYGGIFGATNRAYFAIDTHMGAFCLGAAFATFNYLVPRTPRTPKLVPSIGVAMSLLIITILAFKAEYSQPFTFIFVLPFVGVLSVIMIFCIVKLQSNRHSRRSLPVAIRILDYFGSLSFGIYLFHYPLFVLLSEILPPNAAVWLAPTINIIASLILSWFFTEIFNITKWIQQLKYMKPSRRAVRYATVGLCLVPAIVLLTTTPVTSGISEQLASVDQNSEMQIDLNHHLDYIGVETALENFSAQLDPLYKLAQDSHAAYDTTNRAAPSANAASVLIIGDSVTLGAKEALEATIPNSFVDAKESRGIETATGILANYAATGKLPETIVISLATNERTITGSLLQNIVDVAGQDHKFILVTAYAGPQQPRESQNAALKAYADSHENVFLADWWSVAHDNWSLMYADHIHLNPEGRTTYANLIYNAVRSSNR